jgi:hypothetical protein
LLALEWLEAGVGFLELELGVVQSVGWSGRPRRQQEAMSRPMWVPASMWSATVLVLRRAEVWPVVSVALVAYLAR